MKPVILIVNKFLDDPFQFGPGRLLRVKENYCLAIIRAGGVPVVSALGDARDYARMADGILFTGGDDIAPARYGEENLRQLHWDDALDEMELALFDAFAQEKKPMLGICRGIQLINVALGGSLIQDIPAEREGIHKTCIQADTHVHPVQALPGSRIAQLCGERFLTNTHHHQSVNVPGTGLVPTAWAEDGIIEAVEHETLPILAVQWHPERMIGVENLDLADMMPVFRWFVQQMV